MDTSNAFVDTMNISNTYLKSMCADFDGVNTLDYINLCG